MSPETSKDHQLQTEVNVFSNSQKKQFKGSHSIQVLMGINDNPQYAKLLGEINYNLTGQKALSYPQIRKSIKDDITIFSSIVLSDDSNKNTCKTEILQIILSDNSDFLYIQCPSQKPNLDTKEHSSQPDTLLILYTDTAESNIEKIGEFLTRQAINTK